MAPLKNLRWWIAGLLALATALNYLDRQSLPVVVGEIRKEIPLSNEQYGRLTSLFFFMLFALLVGWLVEHHGYGPAFLIAGVLHPLAFLVILSTVKRIGPLTAPAPSS